MQFSNIKSLTGWCFQIEAVCLVKVQKFGEQQTSPAFADVTPHDLKAQAAMVMLKINRLPAEQRAVLWALHVQRETEMVYLTTHTPCRFGFKTDLDIIRKWATGEGPGCRELGDRAHVNYRTVHRYEKAVIKAVELLMHKAYAALEKPHAEMLERLCYADARSESAILGAAA
ncbi:hypothetical protein [Aquitalea aquatica]|uniref:Uncharacterized protein n=1 Tax=Aquitalea aquatica TaxID=3044273 RepID=A0A838Y4Q3_9NEIS|nr:hypothetical protein [Aquitalea magnusonii]MBA4707527.1 hypothetical protein [Aquitalea magnusonii]